jgi:hyperosmotically inducible periplasmic protein
MRIQVFFALMLFAVTSILVPWKAYSAPIGLEPTALSDQQIYAELSRSLDKSRFKDVHISVSGGIATLTGNVESLAVKMEADKKAHHSKLASAVRNEIEVMGQQIADRELQDRLVQKLEYDRVGYGTTAFNAIIVGVNDGVVTLGGHAYGPTDKDSAISLVSHTPGVLDLLDEIEVDPVSPMDDRLRIRVAQAVYGFTPLNKYAIDPGKPIRISVQNGNVTLYGAVDTKADKDMAYLRANGVSGVFNVTNELQISNERSERE